MGLFGWSYPPGCSGPPGDDNYNDGACACCGADLESLYPEDGNLPDFMFDGFCSKACDDLYASNCQGLIVVRPLYDLLNTELRNGKGQGVEQWRKVLFEGSGTSLHIVGHRGDSIAIGSIVEGIDAEVENVQLDWPFTKEELWDTIHSVKDEHDRLWNETHGCEGCAALNGENDEQDYIHIHPDCPVCDGEGIII